MKLINENIVKEQERFLKSKIDFPYTQRSFQIDARVSCAFQYE